MSGDDVNHNLLQRVALIPARSDHDRAMVSVSRRIFHPEIGARLAKLRERKGFTQGQVEQQSKGQVKKNTLKSIEAGRIENPNPDTLRTLARLYGVQFSEIALPFIEANYGRDLARHFGDQQSGTSSQAGASHDAVEIGLDEQELSTLVDRFSKDARKVLKLSDSLRKIAIALEETRLAAKAAPGRVRRARKTG